MQRALPFFLTLFISLLTCISSDVGILPNSNATTTSRDKLGRTLFMVERTSSLAVVSSFDYSQAVGSWPFSHDGVGNVLRCAENHSFSGMTDRVVSNSYDHCNRLDTETITPATGAATTTDYGYDLADNRVTKTIGATGTTYRFGNGANGANSNQLRNYGPPGQPATHSFIYDDNGNRETRVTAAGTDTYTWEDESRLTRLDTPGGDYDYTYAPRGRRIVRDESSAGGSRTELTFSGGTSVQEANTSGAVQVEFIRGSDWGGGIGGVLFTIRSGTRSYNAYNSRGDVVSTTDDSGAATWQASYEAFGTRTEEDGTNAERQRANTKDEDPTGLLNEGQRYRDLEAGVFISRDPAGFVDGPNVYAYVRQNPWSRFDPEGLSFKDLFDVIRMEGIGGTVRAMGSSVYNDVYGEVEASATQGAYLASQTGSTAEGIGYAAFSMIGGKDLMEADQGKELTFSADGGASTRQLSGEEMKSKAISGTLKLGVTTVSAVAGGISTTRTTVGLTEKLAANIAKKEAGPLVNTALSSSPLKNASGSLSDAANAARNQRHRTPNLTMHARERMATRGAGGNADISVARVQEAVDSGSMKVQSGSPVVTKRISAADSDSGRSLKVVEDVRTNNILTVMDKGSKK